MNCDGAVYGLALLHTQRYILKQTSSRISHRACPGGILLPTDPPYILVTIRVFSGQPDRALSSPACNITRTPYVFDFPPVYSVRERNFRSIPRTSSAFETTTVMYAIGRFVYISAVKRPGGEVRPCSLSTLATSYGPLGCSWRCSRCSLGFAFLPDCGAVDNPRPGTCHLC